MKNGVVVAHESDTVVVLTHPKATASAIVFGPVDKRWRYQLSSSSKQAAQDSRQKAIDLAAKKLVESLANPAAEPAAQKRRPK